MVHHLVENQLNLWGSPRNFSCYCDEGFIGAMKNVCAMSKHPYTLEVSVLEKGRILAGVDEELLCRACGDAWWMFFKKVVPNGRNLKESTENDSLH